MERDRLSRRTFLKNAAAAASLAGLAGCGLLPRVGPVRRPCAIPEGRKLNIACVGVGGMGRYDVRGVAGENLVAFCDVDWDNAATTFEMYPDVPRYKDYRRMLEELDDKIDAVTVTTPDHMHFPIAAEAIKRGKHVYVEKPLAHTVWEARELRKLARLHGVVTQMNNQGRAREGIRLVREWVQAGIIGPVREVQVWTDRPGNKWPQGVNRPKETPPVPRTLDWDLWLGVAPVRPYRPDYAPFKWRGWWDFGTGALGDMGCHIMDAAFWALDLGYPDSIEAETSERFEETAPVWSIVEYRFPARGSMPPVKMTWYDGGKLPPRPKQLEEGREMGGKNLNGQFLIGENATIMANQSCGTVRIIPETLMKELQPKLPPKTIPRVPDGNPYKEWINACKGIGPLPGSNFEYSARLTETVLLGNLAVRTGKKINWDAKNARCDDSEANEYLRMKFRKF